MAIKTKKTTAAKRDFATEIHFPIYRESNWFKSYVFINFFTENGRLKCNWTLIVSNKKLRKNNQLHTSRVVSFF